MAAKDADRAPREDGLNIPKKLINVMIRLNETALARYSDMYPP